MAIEGWRNLFKGGFCYDDGVGMVITYETLFDILRKEKSREDLQVLPATFYEEVRAFLVQPARGAGELAAIEYQNTKKILRELYDRRERKLLLLALNKARTDSAIIDPSLLLPEELPLFATLVAALKRHKDDLLVPLLGRQQERVHAPVHPAPFSRPVPHPSPAVVNTAADDSLGARETMPVERADGARVKFLVAVPKFLGKDATVFGPFKAGDEAELPRQIADILLKKNRIEIL